MPFAVRSWSGAKDLTWEAARRREGGARNPDPAADVAADVAYPYNYDEAVEEYEDEYEDEYEEGGDEERAGKPAGE
jgi:hypothetical protein